MNEYNDTDIEIEKRWSQLEKQPNQPNGSHRIENEKNGSQAVLTIVINTVLDPVSVCPVEWNISISADFGELFQDVSGFLKNNLYIYSCRT